MPAKRLSIALLACCACCAAAFGQNWQSVGPSVMTGNGNTNIGGSNGPVVGSIRSVLADATDANRLFVGAANGGLWRTSNALAAAPTWTALTLPASSGLSIGDLEYDRTDATGNTLIAGIGRFSSFGREGGPRTGLLRSTDGGNSWTALNLPGATAGTSGSDRINVYSVAARGSTILASVDFNQTSNTFGRLGIARSADGGSTWSYVTGNGTSGMPGAITFEMVGDTSSNSRFFAASKFTQGSGADRNGIWRSDDTGANWSRVSNAAMNTLMGNDSTLSNVRIATAAGNVVYAAIANGGVLNGLFRSGDGGANWTALDTPAIHPGGQASIHLSMAVDPTNTNLLYLGGDRSAGSPFHGNMFRINAAAAAGAQATSITTGGNAPHADSRGMTIDAAGNLIEVNDGGIYRRPTPSTTGTWAGVMGDLRVAEVHSATWDRLSNRALIGMQDNGTAFQNSGGSAVFTSVNSGDGGRVAADTLFNPVRTTRYWSSQNLGGFVRRDYDAAGNSVGGTTVNPTLTVVGSGQSLGTFEAANGGSLLFVTPMTVNSVVGGRVYIGTSRRIYESLDRGATLNLLNTDLAGGTNLGTSVALNGIHAGGTRLGVVDADVLYVGTGSNLLLRHSGTAGVLNRITTYTGNTVRGLTVNDRDWHEAFVTDGESVFRTTDAGATMGNVTGSLFSSFLGSEDNSIFSLAYVTDTADPFLLAGTRHGIFASYLSAMGTWIDFDGGLMPNAVVYTLTYDSVDDLVIAGTLGRGVWSLAVTPVPEPGTLVLLGAAGLLALRRRRAA